MALRPGLTIVAFFALAAGASAFMNNTPVVMILILVALMDVVLTQVLFGA